LIGRFFTSYKLGVGGVENQQKHLITNFILFLIEPLEMKSVETNRGRYMSEWSEQYLIQRDLQERCSDLRGRSVEGIEEYQETHEE